MHEVEIDVHPGGQYFIIILCNAMHCIAYISVYTCNFWTTFLELTILANILQLQCYTDDDGKDENDDDDKQQRAE